MLPISTPIAASAVTNDPATSLLVATNAQAAIDRLAGRTAQVVPAVCGAYPNGVNHAAFASYPAVVSACQTVCAGSPTSAHPCTSDDVVRILGDGGTIADSGWLLSGTGCGALSIGNNSA